MRGRHPTHSRGAPAFRGAPSYRGSRGSWRGAAAYPSPFQAPTPGTPPAAALAERLVHNVTHNKAWFMDMDGWISAAVLARSPSARGAHLTEDEVASVVTSASGGEVSVRSCPHSVAVRDAEQPGAPPSVIQGTWLLRDDDPSRRARHLAERRASLAAHLQRAIASGACRLDALAKGDVRGFADDLMRSAPVNVWLGAYPARPGQAAAAFDAHVMRDLAAALAPRWTAMAGAIARALSVHAHRRAADCSLVSWHPHGAVPAPTLIAHVRELRDARASAAELDAFVAPLAANAPASLLAAEVRASAGDTAPGRGPPSRAPPAPCFFALPLDELAAVADSGEFADPASLPAADRSAPLAHAYLGADCYLQWRALRGGQAQRAEGLAWAARRWVDAPPPAGPAADRARGRFRVLSWNVTSAHVEQFAATERRVGAALTVATTHSALQWHLRLPAIVRALLRADADVLLLQEVQWREPPTPPGARRGAGPASGGGTAAAAAATATATASLADHAALLLRRLRPHGYAGVYATPRRRAATVLVLWKTARFRSCPHPLLDTASTPAAVHSRGGSGLAPPAAAPRPVPAASLLGPGGAGGSDIGWQGHAVAAARGAAAAAWAGPHAVGERDPWGRLLRRGLALPKAGSVGVSGGGSGGGDAHEGAGAAAAAGEVGIDGGGVSAAVAAASAAAAAATVPAPLRALIAQDTREERARDAGASVRDVAAAAAARDAAASTPLPLGPVDARDAGPGLAPAGAGDEEGDEEDGEGDPLDLDAAAQGAGDADDDDDAAWLDALHETRALGALTLGAGVGGDDDGDGDEYGNPISRSCGGGGGSHARLDDVPEVDDRGHHPGSGAQSGDPTLQPAPFAAFAVPALTRAASDSSAASDALGGPASSRPHRRTPACPRIAFALLRCALTGRELVAGSLHATVPLGPADAPRDYLPLLDAVAATREMAACARAAGQMLQPPRSPAALSAPHASAAAGRCAALLGTDLNCTPGRAAHTYLVRGEVRPRPPPPSGPRVDDGDGAAASAYAAQARRDGVTGADAPAVNPLGAMSSVYAAAQGQEPAATAFSAAAGFADTLDYIVHCAALRTVRVLALPEWHASLGIPLMPNSVQPSDHLPLVAELEWV